MQDIALHIDSYELKQKVQKIIDSQPTADFSERDIGKEPILESRRSAHHELMADGTGRFVTKEYEEWMCPTCGWFVGELYCGHGMWHIQGEKSYCSSCGQLIDWSKPSDEEKTRYEEKKRREREEREQRTGIKLDNMNEGRRRKYGRLADGKV